MSLIMASTKKGNKMSVQKQKKEGKLERVLKIVNNELDLLGRCFDNYGELIDLEQVKEDLEVQLRIVLEEKNMNEKKKLWIEKTLSDLPFVNWDRFLDLRFEENRVLHVFGWIKREDSYKDFVSLEFDVVNQKVFFIATSSKKYSKRIAEILGCSDHADCQRIEDFFKIENMIKLKERECEQKQKKEELEIIRMKNIYATQMEAYQIDLAKASKGYSYWNHKLKEFYEKEKEVKE